MAVLGVFLTTKLFERQILFLGTKESKILKTNCTFVISILKVDGVEETLFFQIFVLNCA